MTLSMNAKIVMLGICLAGCANAPLEKPRGLNLESEDISISYPQISKKYPLSFAVIDSGINYNRENKDFYKEYFPEDKMGHGTLVSKIVLDTLRFFKTPNVNIVPIRIVKTENDEASSAVVSRAINVAIKNNVKVINLSIEGGNFKLDEYTAIKSAKDHGILVVVSAGNQSEEASNSFPCAYPLDNIICVGSAANNYKSDYSNYGKEVHLMADGTGWNLNDEYKLKSGTSFSAPQITAAAILIWKKNPHWNYAQVKTRICLATDQPVNQRFYSKYGIFSWKKLIEGDSRKIANIH